MKAFFSNKAEEDQTGSDALFSCPKEGCIKLYQRYSALEHHLFYGKCQFLLAKETLLDTAKVMYHEKLKCDATAPPPSLESTSGPHPTTSAELPRGWALRSSKKATRFSEAQRNYLESKLKVGEDTGLKLDPGKSRVTCSTREMQRGKSPSVLMNS